ncbi:MAG: DUF3488 and transglutaminase-like domain-containing protein, partial [Candidatus Omnitrophica bacterium]|nr:DUF3488 and transglutaminase-like domain-containing protein [Candidatus Omnitrophota bacterium]
MKFHRLWGFLLVSVSGTAMILFSQQLFFPLLLIGLALVGVSGRFFINLSRERRVIFYLVLALLFQMIRRTFFYFHLGFSGFFFYSFFYFLGLYFLTLSALVFYFFPKKLPAVLVLFGALVICSAGNIYASERQDLIFQWFSLGFTGLATVFLTSGNYSIGDSFSLGGAGWRVIALLAVLAISFWTGQQVRKNRDVISRAFIERLARMENLRFGFSTTVKLGSVIDFRHRIRENTPVLRIFGLKSPEYLRVRAYDEYRQAEWRGDSLRKEVLPERQSRQIPGQAFFRLRETRSRDFSPVEIWPSPLIEEGMFAPLNTVYVLAPVSRLEMDQHRIFDTGELVGGFSYTDYVSPEISPEILSVQQRRKLLSVPENLSGKVGELAQEIFQGKRTVAEKVAAVEKYFQTHYQYSLTIHIPPGEEPLNYFLLEKPAAHCEYFASGATVLLRLAGVPVRYVVGFLVEERHPIAGYWVARNKDAHAWAEAYGEDGRWMVVEATPPEGLPGRRRLNQSTYLWDLATFYLQRFQVFLRGEFLSYLKSAWISLKVSLRKLWQVTKWDWLILVLTVLLAIVVSFFLPRCRRQADVHLVIQHLLRKVERTLRWQHLVRDKAETLHQFANRLRGLNLRGYHSERLAEWLEAYARARYRGEINQESLRQLTNQLKAARTDQGR